MKPTIFTWILTVFGAITFLPLIVAQFIMLLKPQSLQAKDLIIGKGNEWRDHTHYRSALAFAWADILVILPLLILSTVGVFFGQLWDTLYGWSWVSYPSTLVSCSGYSRNFTPIAQWAGWLTTPISGGSFFTGVFVRWYTP